MNNFTQILSASALLVCSTLALAGPEEDFKEGQKLYYQNGDVIRSVELLRKAADAGHDEAHLLLGSIAYGATEFEEAAKHYGKLAEKNHPEGLFNMGMLYAGGEGVKKDLAKGLAMTRKAAELGSAGAGNAMASAYMNGGLGLEKLDDAGREEAKKWIDLAIKNNNPEAYRFMTRAYLLGNERLAIAKNEAKALEWARMAADKEYPFAYELLANAYRNGELGLQKKNSEARKWEEKYFKKTGRKMKRNTPGAEKADEIK